MVCLPRKVGVLVAILSGVFAPTIQGQNVLDRNSYSVKVYPENPSIASELSLLISQTQQGCMSITPNSVVVDWLNDAVEVSLHIGFSDFGPCPLPASARPPFTINLGVPPGPRPLDISIYEDNQGVAPGNVFDPENLAGTLRVDVLQVDSASFPETPIDGSIQSGVGLVRGWACEAWKVEVQFDDEEKRAVAYGTERTDTNSICGDDDNGYGMVIAWGLLGHGVHTMKTFINNDEISEVEFTVDGLDDPFIKGLSAEYELEGFPVPGDSAVVRWSEADQNFIIVKSQ